MSDRSDSEAEWGSLPLPSVLAAAHELKAPLVLVRQLSYQLEAAGHLSQEQRLVQERIRLTSERALRLVENITKASRLDDAMFALEPLQVGSLWQQVAREMQPLADSLGQKLELKTTRPSMLVVAHPELLAAVLTGLCDNALSHNPTGASIELGAKRRKDAVVFSVRDYGPQIENKHFRHLEQRLGKMPQPLGARPNSSGLGLWIAGSFAKAMKADLGVTRHQRGGMTFLLRVPLSNQLSLL